MFLPCGFQGLHVTGEGGVRGWRLREQRGARVALALTLGWAVLLEGRRQWALVAVLVVELVVPLQDELARPQQLRGGLRGGLADRLRLAELSWEVGGAGAQGFGGGQGCVAEAGGGLEALESLLIFVSAQVLFV